VFPWKGTVFSDPSQKLQYKWRHVLHHAQKSHVTSQDPFYMWIANIMARLGFAVTADYKLSLFGFQRKAKLSTTQPHHAPEKTYMSENSAVGGFMTRPEWQKKKKKMAGREGPKKGKNR